MTVHARVKNGRLLVDEPTDLPEGTELVLVPAAEELREALRRAPSGLPLTEEERERDEAMRRRGPVKPVPHAEVMRQLEERSS